jgi:sodium-dependent dicarboxylate transporter 2/3/5
MTEYAEKLDDGRAQANKFDWLVSQWQSRSSLEFALAQTAVAAFLAAWLYMALPESYVSGRGLAVISTGTIRMTLSAAVFIAALWVMRPVPVAVTSLLPLVLFPVLGIEPLEKVLPAYSSEFLITAGCSFVLGAALHRARLDKRAALALIFIFGPVKSNVVRGVFVISAFLSMWLPSAPLAILLCPVLLSMARLARKFGYAAHHDDVRDMQFVVFCAAACGITIGQICMVTGSHINLAFADYLLRTHGIRVSQVTWLFLGLPVLLISSFWACRILTHVFARGILKSPLISDDVLEDEISRLGPVSSSERTVLFIVAATAALWCLCLVLRICFADSLIAHRFNVMTVSLSAVFLLFFLGTGKDEKAKLVTALDLKSCPWRILFYIGCAFALGHALLSSGSVDYLAAMLSPLFDKQSLLGLISACLIVWLLANIFPNLTMHMLLPVFLTALFPMFSEYTEDAVLAMVLVLSCPLLLPIASASNMVLFAAGFVPLGRFFKVGLAVSAVVIPTLIAVPLLLGDLIKVYHPTESHLEMLSGRPESSAEAADSPADPAIQDDTADKFPLPWHTKAPEVKNSVQNGIFLPDTEE